VGLKWQLKNLVYRSPLARLTCPRYIYNMEPTQLGFLASCVDRTRELPGPILEVGCFVGATTIWLNMHMNCTDIEKPYFVIDTFSGFTPTDLDHEVHKRGKSESIMAFQENDQAWFDKTMQVNGFSRVTSIQADAGSFDYSRFSDLSFVLVDVDLYIPVLGALERLWPQMARGGLIVVDDCLPNNDADGALQAYDEFIQKHGLPRNIVHKKLGVIEAPSA